MAIADDLPILEKKLTELIAKYDQYFIGFEKREPLLLLAEVERLVKQYFNTPINNTMYKYKYNTLVARLNTYREYWRRILRLMEDGKYSRDKFITELHNRQKVMAAAKDATIPDARPKADVELDTIFEELVYARKACNLSVENISRDILAENINRQKEALQQRLGTENIKFRVVIEDGKPKLKASAKRG